jgi:hypothetical protein
VAVAVHAYVQSHSGDDGIRHRTVHRKRQVTGPGVHIADEDDRGLALMPLSSHIGNGQGSCRSGGGRLEHHGSDGSRARPPSATTFTRPSRPSRGSR